MSKRAFRTQDSYDAEHITRDMIKGFLAERGFTNIKDDRPHHGKVESQTIHAISRDGKKIVMRVRLCWRRSHPNETKSAAQILPKIKNNDWEGTLRHKVEHEIEQGVTHTLFIQRELDKRISYAALIPLSDLLQIWCDQRDASDALITAGKLGKRKTNHAKNGSSPTLWLHDEMASDVTNALWEHPGVLDLLKLDIIQPDIQENKDDTYDDLQGVDYSLIGSDVAKITTCMRSNVKRDPRVRKAVMIRAKGKCERAECGISREYSGFLDVHHILGVEKSDRVWNCVALCPNCHREAHASPDQETINAKLLEFAKKYERGSFS